MPGPAHPEDGHGKQSRPDDLGAEQAGRDAKVGEAGPEASRAQTDDPPEDRYSPSPVQVTRERSQGLGFGERDLERQRDPHRPVPPADEDGRADGD